MMDAESGIALSGSAGFEGFRMARYVSTAIIKKETMINGTIVHLFFFDIDLGNWWHLKNKKSFAIFNW